MVRTKATTGLMIKPDRPSGHKNQTLLEGCIWKPLLNASAQDPSPFFRLPPELRYRLYLLIFSVEYVKDSQPQRSLVNPYTLSAFRESDQPASTTRRIPTSFLLVCRRVYNEAALLPISTNVHVLFYPYAYASFPTPAYAPKYFSRMLPWQLACVRKLHVYASRERLIAQHPGTYRYNSAWAELAFLRVGRDDETMSSRLARKQRVGLGGPYPSEVTLTVPYDQSSQFAFESDVPETPELSEMIRNREWENVLGGVRLLKLQVEVRSKTVEYMRLQLKNMISYTWDIGSGEELVCEIAADDESSNVIREWKNVRNIPEEEGSGGENREIELIVLELEWKARKLGF